MNIIEAMMERRSVRSFNGAGLTEAQRDTLNKAIEESWSPFGGNVTIRLKKFDLKEGYRPSTYGMIKGAEDFFLLGIGNDEDSALTAGFRFEQVVLRAWQAGLGACWIAATFKGSDFERGETWPDGEELKIISPVGVAAKTSMMEKVARMTLGSNNRKPFDELFFEDDFKKKISTDNRYREALEMLRIAPSSKNSQPWRALVCGNTVHFYYIPKSPASVLDTAIGMCHFFETETYRGRKGQFIRQTDAPAPPDKWVYLRSYRGE